MQPDFCSAAPRSSTLSIGFKSAQKTPGFFGLSIFNRVGWVWIAIGKTSSVFVGRRCHCLLSTRDRGIEGAWGPIRSSPHASVNTLDSSDLPAVAVKSPLMQQSWRPLLSGKRMRSNACVLIIRILPEVREEQKNPAMAGPALAEHRPMWSSRCLKLTTGEYLWGPLEYVILLYGLSSGCHQVSD